MALPDLTGQNIENTYQRVIQTDGTNFYDGTGSLVNFGGAVFPYTGSAIISGSLIVTGSTEIQYLTASGIPYPTAIGGEGEAIVVDQDGNLIFAYPKAVTERVKNVSGGPLQKGTPVHATGSGASGNITGVVAADAGNPLLMPATFVLNEALADEEEGEALIIGYIKGVNTTGFQSGEVVYVGVGGGFTNVKPTGSALIQNLGLVLKGDSTNGSGVVYGSGRSNDVPNLPPGYAWIGNDNWVATAVPTSSFNEDPFPYTGSAAISGALEVTGNVTIYGTASVDVLITTYESSSIIYASGSTKFGDSLDDTHQFTGSVSVTGSLGINGSLNYLNDGNNTIRIGENIAPNAVNMNNTIAIGDEILNSTTAGTYAGQSTSVYIGHQVGKNVGATANYGNSVWIGYQAGLNRGGAAPYNTTLIGYQAGVGGYSSIAIGKSSMNNGGVGSIGIGQSAGSNNSGASAILIGDAAGAFNTTTQTIAIGYRAGAYSGPDYSVILGHQASQQGTLHNSVILGWKAGEYSNGSNNVAIGYNAITNTSATSVANSIAIGYQSGYLSSGSNNILLGYQAGYNLTGSNQLIIANNSSSALVTGDFENNTFNISGSVSASTYYGDGSNLTGIETDPFPYTGSAVISGSLSIQSNQDDALTIGGSINNTAPSFIKFTNSGTGTNTGASIEFPWGQLIRAVYQDNGTGFRFYDKNQTDSVVLNSNTLSFGKAGGGITFSGNSSTSTIQNPNGLSSVIKYKVGGYHSFESYNGSYFEVARIDNQGIDVTGAISASTYYGDGSNLTGISSDPFPYTGSAVISGSLTLTGSFNALLPTSSTDTYFVTYNTASYGLEARQVATLINPKVEYLDVTASISSGTSITLPNGLSYISSSTYEYLEVFFNGLRLRYDRDFVPTSTTTIQNQITFPSGSELTFKSLKA